MKKKRIPLGNTRKENYARLKVGNGERNRKRFWPCLIANPATNIKSLERSILEMRWEKISKVINEVNVAEEYLEYKNYMATKPNDTVLTRWGMYTHDKRYKDYTASIVKMIMDDMKINSDQAYYMLYYMVSNNIDDYEQAKRDMMVDKNFEIYKTKRR